MRTLKKITFLTLYTFIFLPINTLTWLRSRKYFSDSLQDNLQVDPIQESSIGLLSNTAFQQALNTESESNFIHPTIKTKLIKPILSRISRTDHTSSIKPISERGYQCMHKSRASVRQYSPNTSSQLTQIPIQQTPGVSHYTTDCL